MEIRDNTSSNFPIKPTDKIEPFIEGKIIIEETPGRIAPHKFK